MSEKISLTNGELQRMRNALAILGNRRMANLGADLKVARLLRVLVPYVEPLEALKREAFLAMMDGNINADLTQLQQQALAIRIAARQAEIDALPIEVEVPTTCLLKEADLPKEGSGPTGWLNSSQLGVLVADLGLLYILEQEVS